MRHPDTLADGVAEAISRAYSRYCLKEFGAILHRNTDKASLLGGDTDPPDIRWPGSWSWSSSEPMCSVTPRSTHTGSRSGSWPNGSPRLLGEPGRASGRPVDRPHQHPRPLQAPPPPAVGRGMHRRPPSVRGAMCARLHRRRERREEVRGAASRSLPARSAPQGSIRARCDRLAHPPPRPSHRRPGPPVQGDSGPLSRASSAPRTTSARSRSS
ncbi:methionine adenosyltransferase [Streptomyces adustus]|uniref:methionine adenosyltransferase n=1 Tax=Streptomyces adustus TaxID=1609272 RepID=UPI0035DC9249